MAPSDGKLVVNEVFENEFLKEDCIKLVYLCRL